MRSASFVLALASLLFLSTIAQAAKFRHGYLVDETTAALEGHATARTWEFWDGEGASKTLDQHHRHDGSGGAVPTKTHAFAKRGDLGVYECKNRNWSGPCTWTKADGGACHNWIYGKGGSMGPDKGLHCRIYKAENCNDNGFHLDLFQWPGFSNYATNEWLKENGMTNGPASYKCKIA